MSTKVVRFKGGPFENQEREIPAEMGRYTLVEPSRPSMLALDRIPADYLPSRPYVREHVYKDAFQETWDGVHIFKYDGII